MATFESLGTVSYSPSTATMAISLAVSDVETGVHRHLTSLKMAPFARPHCNYGRILYHFGK